jgi:hypothetical protein
MITGKKPDTESYHSELAEEERRPRRRPRMMGLDDELLREIVVAAEIGYMRAIARPVSSVTL